MYFDNLTLISLLVFAVAFGSFVYACIIRGCITDASRDHRKNHSVSSNDEHDNDRTPGN